MDFSERDPHKAVESDAGAKKKATKDDVSPNSLIKIKQALKQKKSLVMYPKVPDKVSIAGKKPEGQMIKIKSGETKTAQPAIPEKKRVGRPPLSAAAKQQRFEKLE